MGVWIPQMDLCNTSRRESYSKDSFTADVTFNCKYEDYVTAVNGLGNALYPFNPTMACQNVSVEFLGSSGEFIGEYENPSLVTINAHYQTPEPPGYLKPVMTTPESESVINETITEPDGTQWTVSYTERTTFQTEMSQISPVGWFYRNGGGVRKSLKPESAPSKITKREVIVRSYVGVKRVPSWVRDLQGCINSNAYYNPFDAQTYPPNTLLISGGSKSKTVSKKYEKSDDDESLVEIEDMRWNFDISFMYDKDGWDTFKDENGNDMIIYRIENGNEIIYRPYETRPFVFNFT